jgi:hypothetical protein
MVILLSIPLSTKAQYLLEEEFNGTTINPDNWSLFLPFQSSQVRATNGRAVLIGRGTLGSIMTFTNPIALETKFKFASAGDHFSIVLRSDLSSVGEFSERRGIMVAFSQDGGQVSIQQADTGAITILAVKDHLLPLNTDFTVRITDDSSTVKMYLNDYSRPLIQVSTGFKAGSNIALSNREDTSYQTEVDYLRISSLVELSLLPAVELNFFTETNRVYQIQGSIDMAAWVNLGDPIQGSNIVCKALYSTQSATNRYYRVQVSP